MQHNLIDLLKISQRVMCCLVALLLVLSLAAMPVEVYASYIDNDRDVYCYGLGGGSGGGGPLGMAAGAALMAICVNACSRLVVDGAKLFAEDCIEMWEGLSSFAKKWFNEESLNIFSGSAVRLPDAIKDEVESVGKDYAVEFPAEDLYILPQDTTLDFSTMSFEQVFTNNLMDLMQQNLTLLNILSIALSDFQYDAYAQYQVMHDAFYTEVVQTRLALNNTLLHSFQDLYQRVSILSTQMESQFIDTRQSLMNKIDSVSSSIYDNITLVRNQIVAQLISVGGDIRTLNNTIVDGFNSLTKNIGTTLTNTRDVIVNKIDVVSSSIYNNITLVRNQIVEQLVQTRNNVLTELDSINARIDSLAGQISTGIKDGLADVEIGTDTEVALPSTLPGISAITGTLSDVIPGFKDFFNDPGDDDDRRYPIGLPWLPKFMNGENNYFWQMLNDSAFMSAIQSFFNFVAALWLLFPLAVRYLIIFGFGAPLFVSTAKMLVG